MSRFSIDVISLSHEFIWTISWEPTWAVSWIESISWEATRIRSWLDQNFGKASWLDSSKDESYTSLPTCPALSRTIRLPRLTNPTQFQYVHGHIWRAFGRTWTEPSGLMPGSRKPSHRKKALHCRAGLSAVLEDTSWVWFHPTRSFRGAWPGLVFFFCFSIGQVEISCVWENMFNKRSGGRISEVYILPSRILKKNRNGRQGAELPGRRRAAGGRCVTRRASSGQEGEQPAGRLATGKAPVFQEGSSMHLP